MSTQRTETPMPERCTCPDGAPEPVCIYCVGPYVCPGCHAVGGERCAPGCIDDEIRREHEDAITYGDFDRMGDDDDE